MKNKRFFGISIMLFLFLLSITSCVSKKEIIYLQDIDSRLSTKEISNYDNIIAFDDILRVVVTSENMESVQPFTQLVGQVANKELIVNGQGVLQSYLVDSEGYINFPILGAIKAAGLSRSQLEDSLQKQLIRYVTDVQVDVRIINYKITVLGEVTSPGTFRIADNRVTLLQAIGLAGDLTVYGRRDNIIILRDFNGVQKSARVDITSADFIYSPYYYLQQNDTVVVEPNSAQIQASGFNRNISIYVSIASLLLSTIVVISNLSR